MSLLHALRSSALLVCVVAPITAQTTSAPAKSTSQVVPLSPADSTRFMELGRSYSRWLFAGRADSLASAMTPEMLEGMGGVVGLPEQMAQVAERSGPETKILSEKMTRRNGLPQFWHEGEFALFTEEPLVFRFVLNESGKIAGMGMGPKSRAPFDQ